MLELNKIYHGNALDLLKQLDDNSIDSIVTDPPYELGFMGKSWDKTGIAYNVELWKECLRVLKPGGHLLAFGGSRTYHRMACAIEDAGFEIRDQIQWIYGSGFPKSYNISKGIDKKFGAKREVIGISNNGSGNKGKLLGVEKGGGGCTWDKSYEITAPATDLAKQWDGWGTALKPAHEPIVMARKPLSEKNIVDNVLKWGTGGINIDDCRIEGTYDNSGRNTRAEDWKDNTQVPNKKVGMKTRTDPHPLGRFPANVILDEEAGRLLDEQSGFLISKKGKQREAEIKNQTRLNNSKKVQVNCEYDDAGGASRFFYCPKASKKERGEGNNHPTVKPLKLMEYLVRLVTPKNGIVLDPFAGSGTTLIAAKNEGMNYIGFELEEEYINIIHKRFE